MNNKLAQKAIKAALRADWKKAIDLNTEILEEDIDDIDALNRLAKAYAASGDINKAKTLSKKALTLEPSNPIANKCLEKWNNFDKSENTDCRPVNAIEFLEIPGKTKIIPLINLGDDGVISQIGAADQVELRAHMHRVCVYTLNGKYIGRLPDDVAARLKRLMEYGNEYNVYIKKCRDDDVTIFVKEHKRSKQLKNIPSFTSQKIDYISFEITKD